MTSAPTIFSRQEVRERLDYAGCIAAMRTAMADLSADERGQPLRNIVDLGDARLFGVMPGLLAGTDFFGAKLVSVFRDPENGGRSAHRGVVVLFGRDGHVDCIADAEEVTEIRTGSASAVATDALARPDASTLAIFGYGTQARSHLRAIRLVRPLSRVLIWGRDSAAAQAFADEMAAETGLDVVAQGDPEAAAKADIICTVTSSASPVLRGDWVEPGTHVNAVGSSYAGPTEVDTALVCRSRYYVDYKPSALAAAAEFLLAKAEGAIDDTYIRGEVGEVVLGRVEGRTGEADITFYKSLGHVAQDLAALRYLIGTL